MTSRKRLLMRKIHSGSKLVGNEAFEAAQLGLGELSRSENGEFYLSTMRSFGIHTPHTTRKEITTMTETPQQLRLAAMQFGEEAYGKMRHHRLYATDEQNKIALGALTRAMFIRRIEEGRSGTDARPTPWEEFFGIIDKLAAAGANVLQRRPGEPKPPPRSRGLTR
jgi:hypothetical protein